MLHPASHSVWGTCRLFSLFSLHFIFSILCLFFSLLFCSVFNVLVLWTIPILLFTVNIHSQRPMWCLASLKPYMFVRCVIGLSFVKLYASFFVVCLLASLTRSWSTLFVVLRHILLYHCYLSRLILSASAVSLVSLCVYWDIILRLHYSTSYPTSSNLYPCSLFPSVYPIASFVLVLHLHFSLRFRTCSAHCLIFYIRKTISYLYSCRKTERALHAYPLSSLSCYLWVVSACLWCHISHFYHSLLGFIPVFYSPCPPLWSMPSFQYTLCHDTSPVFYCVLCRDFSLLVTRLHAFCYDRPLSVLLSGYCIVVIS